MGTLARGAVRWRNPVALAVAGRSGRTRGPCCARQQKGMRDADKTFRDRYPIVVTSNLDECREFYVRYLGFEVGFTSTWFTWLTTADGSATIAFMSPDHPSRPPGPEEFAGAGLCFELEVADAAATLAAMRARGLNEEYSLTDEQFGQRRFGLKDPAGVWIDVIEQIEPEAGYWDRYLTPASGPGAA